MVSGEEPAGICGCGRPLLVVRNAEGKRIGVTHTLEDENHHLAFWSPRAGLTEEQVKAAFREIDPDAP